MWGRSFTLFPTTVSLRTSEESKQNLGEILWGMSACRVNKCKSIHFYAGNPFKSSLVFERLAGQTSTNGKYPSIHRVLYIPEKAQDF